MHERVWYSIFFFTFKSNTIWLVLRVSRFYRLMSSHEIFPVAAYFKLLGVTQEVNRWKTIYFFCRLLIPTISLALFRIKKKEKEKKKEHRYSPVYQFFFFFFKSGEPQETQSMEKNPVLSSMAGSLLRSWPRYHQVLAGRIRLFKNPCFAFPQDFFRKPKVTS